MSGAVFLSYAREDGDAAKRIADALRAHGVEVWFDQSELRGGDAWDDKIRKQIKDCTLFLPIISAHTQKRPEGYFRLEWHLAEQRSHLIARGRAFLLPVVVDATPETEALVPDAFLAVQWTSLPGGSAPAEFCARTKELLQGTIAARAAGPTQEEPGKSAALRPGGKKTVAILILAVALVAAAASAIWFVRSRQTATGPDVSPEAASLVKQAHDLIYDPDSARSEFQLADSQLDRATQLAPSWAPAWATAALCDYWIFWRAYDLNHERLVRAEADAQKALRLDPRSADALLAAGLCRQWSGQRAAAQAYLDKAAAIDPTNPRVLIALAFQVEDQLQQAQLLEDYSHRTPRPAELIYYEGFDLGHSGRPQAAASAFDRSLAAGPFWRTYVARCAIEAELSADPAKMDAWLAHVPEARSDEPRVALQRYHAAMLRRDGRAAVRALEPLAGDDLEDNFYVGPKSYLLADAYRLAGETSAAQDQWTLAATALRTAAAADPNNLDLRAMLAIAEIREGQRAEGKRLADACAQDERLGTDIRVLMGGGGAGQKNEKALGDLAYAYTLLGEIPTAVAILKRSIRTLNGGGTLSPANLKADARWDPLRGNADFQALLRLPGNR